MNATHVLLTLLFVLSPSLAAAQNPIVEALREPTEAGAAESPGELTAVEPLAVRSEPKFGVNIVGNIAAGQTFAVKSRKGAWFEVDGGWTYIAFNDFGGISQRQVTQAAYNLHNMTPFPYEEATKGGVYGCAQVVSTALLAAGALDRTSLGVREVMSMLEGKGWRKVTPGQWRDGDVVTWATYDDSGDGVTDPDTHIGIVVVQNGTAFAINNSSGEKRPLKNKLDGFPAPVSSLLRKEGP